MDMVESLDHAEGVAVPAATSRYPTPREIQQTLEALDGYRVEHFRGTGHWYATVWPAGREGWATLIVPDYDGRDDVARSFYFEKGSPELNLLILERLSRVCGPLVIVPDTGSDPVIVAPGLDIDQALHSWSI